LASLAALAALALAGVAVARSRARPAAVAALVLAAAGCAAALASAREMADHMASEAVVVRRETARLAPAASALPSFECQEGALLRVVESSGTWLKIARGDDRGWLPASAVCRTASRP
jgi:hypothetical protein